MARKNPVPESEVAIGRRLMLVREKLLIAKTRLAIEIGITRERLFNYESGRTPLPWSIGLFVCNVFSVSPLWLANGQGKPFLSHGFGDDRDLDFTQPKLLFSEGVATLGEEEVALIRMMEVEHVPGPPTLHSEGAKRVAAEMVSAWLDSIPPVKAIEFISELREFGDRLVRRLKR